VIHRILANSTLYELVQTLTGSRISEARMRSALGVMPPGALILDAGGGTGILARMFDRGHRYVCMDIDLARVRFARNRGAEALVGDASRMPVGSNAIDLVVLRAVSHHLADEAFAMMVDESWRVLKPDGRLLFLDAIWAQSWLPGRLLWRIDQGSHPRTEDQMLGVLDSHFELEGRMTYAVHHRYFLALARPKGKTPMQ
jgi:ubiquinone/menaquinone biosynthesis C-methylase UbiE